MYATGSDLGSTSALTGAVDWLRGVLLGSVGTSIAVLAVAAVGLLMLTGRVPLKRGATVILGCFVLFSAATIAEGLTSMGRSDDQVVAPLPLAVATYKPSTPTSAPYDPYAGASVPTQPTPQPIIR